WETELESSARTKAAGLLICSSTTPMETKFMVFDRMDLMKGVLVSSRISSMNPSSPIVEALRSIANMMRSEDEKRRKR
ncbi:hypothetical protein PMAYCL1PPCAC_27913, partial [Pristionchus mayeri]